MKVPSVSVIVTMLLLIAALKVGEVMDAAVITAAVVAETVPVKARVPVAVTLRNKPASARAGV